MKDSFETNICRYRDEDRGMIRIESGMLELKNPSITLRTQRDTQVEREHNMAWQTRGAR